jgi:serine/threonine protein kinase
LTNPPKEPVIPAGLRPPELVLTGVVDKSLDIWAFGCLVFQLITGEPLFCAPWFPSESHRDDDHLLFLTARLGPLPIELYKHWKRSSLYFTPERRVYNLHLGGVREGEEPIEEIEPMEELFDKIRPDLDKEESRKVKALIRKILQYNPAARPSAAEILGDKWFC